MQTQISDELHSDSHGWQGSVDGQHFYQAAVALSKIRGGLSQGVFFDVGGSEEDRNLVRSLYLHALASGTESSDFELTVLVDTPERSFNGMMRTRKHSKVVGKTDLTIPTSTPRLITYEPQGTVRTIPTTFYLPFTLPNICNKRKGIPSALIPTVCF